MQGHARYCDSEWIRHGLWPQGSYNSLEEINHIQKIHNKTKGCRCHKESTRKSMGILRL